MAQTPPSNIAQALQRIDMIRTNMETASRQLNLDNLKKLVDDAEQTKNELSSNLNNLFSNIHGLSAQDLNQSIQSITDLERRLGNTINAINTLIPFNQGRPGAGQTGPSDDSGSGDGGMGQQWPVAPTETPVLPEQQGATAPSDEQQVPIAEQVGGYNWRSKRKSRRNKRSSKKSTTKKSTRKHKKSKNKSKSR
jgi:hypothetical protein